MQLPNKLYSYKNSTLALLPGVLTVLKEGPMDVIGLYDMMNQGLKDPTDFMSVMDCAYALRQSTLMNKGRCSCACRNQIISI